MNVYKLTCAVFAALLGACTGDKGLDITILPAQYVTGNVTSPLATAVVDEIVKQKPPAVHIHTCKSTPPERVQQFNTELKARLEVKTTMTFTAKGCEASTV